MRPVVSPAPRRRRRPGPPAWPLRSRRASVRSVVMAATMLMLWGTAALAAAEAVIVPMSCGHQRNRVELAPSAGSMEMLTIVGVREHKTFRLCTFGRCRSLELQRFEVLCGGRPVSWRLIAGQLLGVAAGPVRQPSRLNLKWWEAQALLAEPEFAPVEELGARIVPVLEGPALQHGPGNGGKYPPPPPPSEPATVQTGTPETPRPEAQRPEAQRPDTGLSAAGAVPSGTPNAGNPDALPGSGSPGVQEAAPAETAGPPPRATPTMPLPADGASPVDTRPADANLVDISPVDIKPVDSMPGDIKPGDVRPAQGRPAQGGPAEGKSGEPGQAPEPAGTRAAAPANGFATPLANPLVSAAVAALALVIVVMATVSAVRWVSRRLWWLARARLRRRPGGAAGDPAEPDDGVDVVRACRELMREISRDLVDAMAAVNDLNGVPALQGALKSELDSIRQSVGFTQSGRARVRSTDFIQMQAELALSLQALRRIIDIAAAASASFSAIPADVIITTRPQAYAFLGVNASASEAVLKKAVNALRRCWHPDLATDEADRRVREERIKQINAAWDVITGKHIPA